MRVRVRSSIVLAVQLVGLLPVVGTGPGRAAPADCAPAGTAATAAPWGQQLLGLDRVAAVSTGTGITVAVLGSGVDAGQPALRGRVRPGVDLTGANGPGDADCAGTGTQLAGIIAAADGQTGVAAGAVIVPVRVVDAGAADTAQRLAAGVNWAVQNHARVIDMGPSVTQDDPTLRAAVAAAVAADVAVVAPAGDLAAQGDPTPYPAAYPGVVGVGAIDPGGGRATFSQTGPYVDLVAPGVGVSTVQRGSGLTTVDGTAVAAAFVAGSLALVLARYPTLSAVQAIARLAPTAAPAAGRDRDAYGAGIVSPYAAITAPTTGAVPAGPAAPNATPLDLGSAPRGPTATAIAPVAGLVATAVLAAAAFAVAAAAGINRGRRRRWRPGLARPSESAGDGDPGPPMRLFQDRGD